MASKLKPMMTTTFGSEMAVPLYISAIGLVMLASAVWRHRRRDMVGMAASLVMAALAGYVLLR